MTVVFNPRWKGRTPPRILTIAGSDSGGGAGIQADLKTISALGAHGLVAVTSITAQNTVSVRGIHDVPTSMVEQQILAVHEDLGVDAAKTGMLSNSSIVETVARTVARLGFPLVVDPVMIAKSGAKLLREEAVQALRKKLIPEAFLITPNRMEAEVLWGHAIKSLEDAEKAAVSIHREYGVPNVVVKGGHILEDDRAVDVLFAENRIWRLESPRIREACTHGTGCSFSAAIATLVGWGYDAVSAVKKAKKFIYQAIQYGLRIGRGACPVNPSSWTELFYHRELVLRNLRRAAKILYQNSDHLSRFAPEVQINLVMSLPYWYAKTIEDVAGFPGRIVYAKGKFIPARPPAFGASKHMAKAVLTLMEFDPALRAGMNLHYDKDFVATALRLGYSVGLFDRREEPPEIRDTEGATTPWGVRKAVENAGGPPDIIVDLGGYGKEPLMFIFGHTAVSAVRKAVRIAMNTESKAT